MFAFTACIVFFKTVGNGNILNAIYTMASYTYGPLLGLFAFGMLTRRKPRAWFVPIACVVSPVVCFAMDWAVRTYTTYRFGYELLMVNGLLVFLLLLLSSTKFRADDTGGDSHI